MITLITGVPGAGKTLYMVDQILTDVANGTGEYAGRPERAVYVDNVPDLQLRHEVAPDLLDWPTWAPDGCLIVCDEVQRKWRPTASSQAPHPSIAELETHRHRGVDFVILTQHPSLVHSNVRRLVGKHIHIRRTALGIMVYEWSECQGSPDTAWKAAVSKRKWEHPKRSFGLYKSAEVHNKVKFRIPRAKLVLWGCVLLLPLLAWAAYQRISSRAETVAPVAAAVGGVVSPASSPGARPAAPAVALPWGSDAIWLSGISIQRQRGNAMSWAGTVLFVLERSGARYTVADDELSAFGWTVSVMPDDRVYIRRDGGKPVRVLWEPRRVEDVPPVIVDSPVQTASL